MTTDLRAEFPNLTIVDRTVTAEELALLAILEQRLAALRRQGHECKRWGAAFPHGAEAALRQVWAKRHEEAKLLAHDPGSDSRLYMAGELIRYASQLKGQRETQLLARMLLDADAQGGLPRYDRRELEAKAPAGTAEVDPGPDLAIDSVFKVSLLPWPSARLVALSVDMSWSRWVLQDPARSFVEHLDAFVARFADLQEVDLARFAGDPATPEQDSHAHGFTNENMVVGYDLDTILAWQAGAPVDEALRQRPSYQWLDHVWRRALSRSALLTPAYALALAVAHVEASRDDLCDYRGYQGFKRLPFDLHVAELRAARKAAQAAAQAALPQVEPPQPWTDAQGKRMRATLRQAVPTADHVLTLEFGDAGADVSEAFAGQANGLLGLQVPGLLSLVVGAQHTTVDLAVYRCASEPPLPNAGWTELVQGDWTLQHPADLPRSKQPVEGLVLDVDGTDHASLALPPGRYRVRLGVSGFAAGDTHQPERMALALWPLADDAVPQPDAVLRVHSPAAQRWHAEVQAT
ncbi:MAG: hypothetical protein ACK5O3_01000 [Burkholderiales bacterium]|jgi:hypothetical protein